MTGKQKHKLAKRAHIAAVIATQEAWIENEFFILPGNRRERDSLFGQALKAAQGKKNASR